jgi:phenylalanine-4-hydroxylase
MHQLARLYWYTIEFGLIREAGDIRLFGAGIMSSPTETRFALQDPSPNRVQFNLERVLRANYWIDDFQQTYFIVESSHELLDAVMQNFGPLYRRLVDGEPHAPKILPPPTRCTTSVRRLISWPRRPTPQGCSTLIN